MMDICTCLGQDSLWVNRRTCPVHGDPEYHTVMYKSRAEAQRAFDYFVDLFESEEDDGDREVDWESAIGYAIYFLTGMMWGGLLVYIFVR